jgi:proteasome lid subunit RPN8/RPN11
MDHLCMTSDVYKAIKGTVGNLTAETGGPLGWSPDGQVVQFFRFDESSRNTHVTYSPDVAALNEMFREDWNPRGIRLAGFVHSHPSGFLRPSTGDIRYAERILAAIPDLLYLMLPIIATVPDTGEFRLLPFAMMRDGDSVRPVRLKLHIVNDEDVTSHTAHAPISAGRAADATDAGRVSPDASSDPAFQRVRMAYDLGRMARVRLVAVGTGGAAAFLEDLARCGVGEFVLIDPDTVAESNIATQQVYRKDLGQPKVTAIAERLRDVNPAIKVREVCMSLDRLDDRAVESLCREPFGPEPPVATLLCGLTDNFYVQARVNALALHLGLPSLCAQVWREGRGAEITFTYPGLTPACHRCILASRYRAYLAEGYVNDVTSSGTPIFATTRLNAIKGFIALALLHYRGDVPGQPPGARFAGLAARIGARNLLMLRMDPDLSETLGIGTFDKALAGADAPSLLFDETLWRTQEPLTGLDGTEPCPDCGGTGDLRDAIGTFTDTRTIRAERG